MKCDICGQDVENSEDLEKHKEQTHPKGVGDSSIDSLERPDLLGETVEESELSELPNPVH